MIVILGWLLIGISVGWAIAAFAEGRGGLKTSWNIVAGLVGGLVGGFASLMVGGIILGDLPMAGLFSFVSAAISALVLVILARVIFK